MSYQLSCTEDDAEVKKAVDDVQGVYNAQGIYDAQGVYDVHGKREWVKWAGKTLMPRLHVQMAMEQADAMRAEQEELEEMRRQDEREQREREQAEKEAELEERETEYIWQVDTKEIDDERFWELVNELDLERVMAQSVAEGPATTQATTQDEEVGESEREESVEEEPAAAEAAVESSTVGKGKRKAVPARAKVYAEMDEPVSDLTTHRQSALTCLLTVQLVLHAEDEAEVYHHST
jgi:hypothetical protein